MVKVALRIGAILILINLLEKMPFSVDSILYSWQNDSDLSAIIYSMAPGIFALIIAFLMWFCPETLASKFSNSIEIEQDEHIKSSNFPEILISIVGLYILVNAVSDFIYHLVLIIVSINEKLPIPAYERAAFVATIFEIIIGLFLLYGSGLVHRIIKQIKKEINTKSL